MTNVFSASALETQRQVVHNDQTPVRATQHCAHPWSNTDAIMQFPEACQPESPALNAQQPYESAAESEILGRDPMIEASSIQNVHNHVLTYSVLPVNNPKESSFEFLPELDPTFVKSVLMELETPDLNDYIVP